jgi:3-hydroxyacyl-[acyl-carrier-protein] dehydratase
MRLEYFQLIDRITDINLTDLTIRAETTIPDNSTIFEGHFPGFPLMPGVLLIETMAQTSGWLIIARNRFGRMPFLASIKEAKLRSFATPGQVLTVDAKLSHEGSGFAVAEAEIRAAGKLICNAEITFRLMGFINADFRASMEQTAAVIGLPIEATVDG